MTTQESQQIMTSCKLSKKEQEQAKILTDAIVNYFSIIPNRHMVANTLVFTGISAFSGLYPETNNELIRLINEIFTIVDKARDKQISDPHKNNKE